MSNYRHHNADCWPDVSIITWLCYPASVRIRFYIPFCIYNEAKKKEKKKNACPEIELRFECWMCVRLTQWLCSNTPKIKQFSCNQAFYFVHRKFLSVVSAICVIKEKKNRLNVWRNSSPHGPNLQSHWPKSLCAQIEIIHIRKWEEMTRILRVYAYMRSYIQYLGVVQMRSHQNNNNIYFPMPLKLCARFWRLLWWRC